MSVAELKVQAATLSFEELSELSRHVRTLALTKDPARRAQLKVAQKSPDWLPQSRICGGAGPVRPPRPVSYSYVIERSAAEAVFRFSSRERRLLQAAFAQIARRAFPAARFR